MKRPAFAGLSFLSELFDEPDLLEGLESATLLHRLETFGGDDERNFLAKLREKDGLLLEVHLTAALAGRVELRGARAVGIPAADARALTCDYTFTCHSRGILTRSNGEVKSQVAARFLAREGSIIHSIKK